MTLPLLVGSEEIMSESEPVPRLDLWRGGGCRVPESVGKCPECGGQLEVLCMSWDEATGQPIAPDLEIICTDEPIFDGDRGINHSWNQSRWLPVKESIALWAEASVSSYGRIVGLGPSVQ